MKRGGRGRGRRGRRGRNPFLDKVYEKENLIYVLGRAKKAILSKDTFLLHDLSDRTVHNASIYQDPDSIAVAVLVYSLGKITERPRYAQYEDWPMFEKAVLSNLDNAVRDLESDRTEAFRNDLAEIRKAVSRLSGHLKIYIEDVFRKAAISKASRIYEHGISMEQTAGLLGITLFELAEYAGKTGISDVNLGVTLQIQKRLKLAEDFFR